MIIKKWNITKLANAAYPEIQFVVHGLCFSLLNVSSIKCMLKWLVTRFTGEYFFTIFALLSYAPDHLIELLKHQLRMLKGMAQLAYAIDNICRGTRETISDLNRSLRARYFVSVSRYQSLYQWQRFMY